MRPSAQNVGRRIIVRPCAAIREVATAEKVERRKTINMDGLRKELHIFRSGIWNIQERPGSGAPMALLHRLRGSGLPRTGGRHSRHYCLAHYAAERVPKWL